MNTSARPVDQLDVDIVKRLRQEPLVSNATLSRDLGVTKATIGSRIRRLQDEGVARVIGTTPIGAAGYGVLIWATAKLEGPALGHPERVAQQLMSIVEVIAVASQIGDHQMMFYVMARDLPHLETILEERIGPIEGIAALRLSLISAIHKDRNDIGARIDTIPSAPERFEYLRKTLLGQRLDETEMRILAEFQVNGRVGFREVSRRTNASEAVVRSKLRGLREADLIRFVTVIHPSAFGMSRVAAVHCRVDHRRLSSVETALAQRPEVALVTRILGGSHRLVIVVTVRSDHDIASFLNGCLARLDGVLEMRISNLMIGYKHDAHWMRWDAGGHSAGPVEMWRG